MLESHTNAIEKILLAQSEAAQNAGHPNLRGGPREWFIRDFLTNHLPSSLEIGQGEIIDENSKPEPAPTEYRNQVDIVISRRDLPKILYSKDNAAYLAEGVVATIESKTKLTNKELKKACDASRAHKSLTRSPPLHSFGSAPNGIVTYVVAFGGPANIGTVANWMPQLSRKLAATPDELVDMIVVLGKGVVWNVSKFTLVPKRNLPSGHNWAYVSQEERNVFLMFTHFLTWMSTLSSPPDTRNYASSILFQQYATV
jgi:hypothetical protein